MAEPTQPTEPKPVATPAAAAASTSSSEPPAHKPPEAAIEDDSDPDFDDLDGKNKQVAPSI